MPRTSSQIPDPAIHKWPANASNEYIKARSALQEKEYALHQQIEEVAAQRRALTSGPILQSYTFEEGPQDLNSDSPTRKTTLAELAKPGELGHKTLVVYHVMMGEDATTACPSCSMFIDGLNGVAKHLSQRLNLAIIGKAPLHSLRAYAKKRGWNDIRILSSFNSSFNKDMGVEAPDWYPDMSQGPGMSVFVYEDGDGDGDGGEWRVRFWYQTSPHYGFRDGKEVIRGMDLLSPVWNMLDITPEGRGEWDAGLGYVEKWDGVKF